MPSQRTKPKQIKWIMKGVTLAQLVKASVGQADVQRFEPHLGHNWLSCGVFLVKSRHFGLPLAQTTMAKLAISLSGWLGRYTNMEYLQSYNTTFFWIMTCVSLNGLSKFNTQYFFMGMVRFESHARIYYSR